MRARTTGSRPTALASPRSGNRSAAAGTAGAKRQRPPIAKPSPAGRRGERTRPATPLYLQLAGKLIDGIQSGRYPVGSLLPREVELSAIHKVSRQTVRHAIAELRQKGLVSARKGVGTRVESVKAARRFNYSAQSVADLFTMAAETVMTVKTRTMTVARGKLAAQLGCRSGHRWLHLGCLRTMANESRPLCWTDIFIDGRFAPIVRTQAAFRSAVFGLIEKEAGETVVEIQQEIRAIVLADTHASRIAATSGGPALEITRRYFSTGRRLIQVSVNTIPADRFFYSVEILRETAANR
jgi:DNA-binding GntR family transcriptional regulator